jgi:hypothetical protein
MGIQEEIEFKGLVMRSVPDDARELFKQIALEEFDNHYGITLRAILFDFLEYRRLKQMFFNSELKDVRAIFAEKEDNSKRDINGKEINLWRK